MTKPPRLLIVDLDGTINTSSERRKEFAPNQARVNDRDSWLSWHLAHTREAPVLPRIDFVNELAADGWTVILLSMRDIRAKATTIEQLKEWKLNYSQLVLTSPGDHRTPPRMKADVVELLKENIVVSTGLIPRVLFIDDDEEVCQAVRQTGANVMQVIKAMYPGQC